MKDWKKGILTSLLFIFTMSVEADTQLSAFDYEQRWIEILTEENSDKRVKPLKALLTDINKSLNLHSEAIDLYIVQGNTNLEIANALHNLSALSYFRAAKKSFKKAIRSKPLSLDGMAEASLASALYWAPGWFGDKDEAISLFDRSLKMQPNSFELHTQYAYVLHDKGETTKALNHFKNALKSLGTADMNNRDVLISIRKSEIIEFLDKIEKNDPSLINQRFWDRRDRAS